MGGNGLYQEAFRQLDQCLLERMLAFHCPALSMALTDQNRVIRLSTYGHADMECKHPVQPDHMFAIGSIGKAFTGVAVLQAFDQHLLDLRAPVSEYLPWFEVKSKYQPITIHHLLTHSSGLARGTDFSPDPRSEVFAMREHSTGFKPGSHFYYSDAGYKVLGLVLQTVTGKPYRDIIQEGILDPLEMKNTVAVMTHHLRLKMAIGYRHLYDDRPQHTSHPLVPADWIETDSGDGCIVSTAEDMAKFALMLLNEGLGPHDQILSEVSYKKMVSPMIEDEGEAYSYGLYLFEDDGYRHAGHGGDVPGYEAYLWLDLDNSLGTVVLMTTPYAPRASFLALEYFRAAHLGLQLPETPSVPDFTHVGNPAEYSGIYQSAQGQVIFEGNDHHLVLVTQDARVVLEERGNDRFYANHPDWNLFVFQFSRNADKNICEVFFGPTWYTNEKYQGQRIFNVPPDWDAFSGHYRSHNPWMTNFRVFHRKGQLILSSPAGDEDILVPTGENSFRVGEDEYIPERIMFDQFVNGQALRAVYSGCPYYRFFTP